MGRTSRFSPLRDDVFSSPGVERNSSATLTTPGCSEATSRKGSAERQGVASAQPRPRSEDAAEHVWREAPVGETARLRRVPQSQGSSSRSLRRARGARHWHTRSTSARHRIRHGIRHTAARAGRRHRRCVANGRLRHMLIGSARVSKVDVSKSLDLQRDALQAEGVDLLFQAQGRAETSTTGHR